MPASTSQKISLPGRYADQAVIERFLRNVFREGIIVVDVSVFPSFWESRLTNDDSGFVEVSAAPYQPL